MLFLNHQKILYTDYESRRDQIQENISHPYYQGFNPQISRTSQPILKSIYEAYEKYEE